MATFIAIDLKSFYASVECSMRALDPLTTNLVVADASRTEKTICLAVSPSLKAYGIPGRPRLFEVVQKVKEINYQRARKARLVGKSSNALELNQNNKLAVDYIVAPPQMALYMKVSTQIYNIYLKYVAPEDIHVYSIDEVFMDVTHYLNTYKMSAEELARKMIGDVLSQTSITATAGIGTNLYLAKIAMDIHAKHMKADEFGVRVASLDEMSYRQELWAHRPLSDFWRIGPGIAKKLEEHRMFTMGDVARVSLRNEELLYKLFGINAELIIDHAWGVETCTMKAIKEYKPSTNCVSSGQVLSMGYEFEKAKLVAREMADQMALDLVSKGVVTDQVTLNVGYDIQNTTNPSFRGEVEVDYYGRSVPKGCHGSKNLDGFTSSDKLIRKAIDDLFDKLVDRNLLVRRLYVGANNLIKDTGIMFQGDLFDENPIDLEIQQKQKKVQQAVLQLKEKFGKNAVLKGMNLEKGATMKDRNQQIGGHKA